MARVSQHPSSSSFLALIAVGPKRPVMKFSTAKAVKSGRRPMSGEISITSSTYVRGCKFPPAVSARVLEPGCGSQNIHALSYD